MSEVPRNFEMKIALLDQKEAETNASFSSSSIYCCNW